MIVALAIAAAVTGCGKKGAPLAPFIRVPVAVENLTPRRVGDDVYVSFTVPAANIDGSTPASIARVELYAATALTPPARARFLEIATRVDTVPVAPAADPADADAGAVMPEPDPKAGALQGRSVTLRDRITPEAMVPRELTVLPEERRAAQATVGLTAAPRVTALRRFYMAIAFSRRGVPGPPSPIVELGLTALPAPPTGLEVTLSANAATLRFEPSGGLLGWLLDRALPLERAPFAEPVVPRTPAAPATSEPPPGPTRYNVYRELAPDPLVLPDTQAAVLPWNLTAPQALNPAPLATLTYSDPIVLDERERCYSVRAVLGAVESAASERVCVTPYDIYPPAAPINLTTVAGEGVINLFCEPNVEDDLGGYIVLRAEAGGDTLLQLTATPLREPRFSDRGVTPGVRYTYLVRAVDSRVPLPNTSEPAEASETAR